MSHTNAGKIYNLVGAEAVLTEASDLRKYLTGISTSFGYVVTDKNGTVFYTDSRYLESAVNQLKGSEIQVRQYKAPLEDLLKGYRQVAVPFNRILYPDYAKLKDIGLDVVDSSSAFTSAMTVKEDYEIELITQACKITDRAFSDLLGYIKEGMTENEVAARLEFLMRSYGASGTSFDTIVAFGENSSVPHHETGHRKLKYGDIILIDFGCKVGGYCSDCTRTFLFGDNGNNNEFKETYKKVLEAHMLVKDKTVSGMTGKQADAVARNVLKGNGLDSYFTHSLGHGIGINVHEIPYLAPRSADILKNGMVFSDEPGVYFEGKFGIRIEDTVTLKNDKVVSLTDSDKNLLII